MEIYYKAVHLKRDLAIHRILERKRSSSKNSSGKKITKKGSGTLDTETPKLDSEGFESLFPPSKISWAEENLDQVQKLLQIVEQYGESVLLKNFEEDNLQNERKYLNEFRRLLRESSINGEQLSILFQDFCSLLYTKIETEDQLSKYEVRPATFSGFLSPALSASSHESSKRNMKDLTFSIVSARSDSRTTTQKKFPDNSIKMGGISLNSIKRNDDTNTSVASTASMRKMVSQKIISNITKTLKEALPSEPFSPGSPAISVSSPARKGCDNQMNSSREDLSDCHSSFTRTPATDEEEHQSFTAVSKHKSRFFTEHQKKTEGPTSSNTLESFRESDQPSKLQSHPTIDLSFLKRGDSSESEDLTKSAMISPERKAYFTDAYKKRLRPNPVKDLTPPRNILDDYEFLSLISKGKFGRVWLVRKRATDDLYAMKIVELQFDKGMKNQLKSLNAEKKVYERIEGQFVVKALETFRHEQFLCFVMEFMIGGDFAAILDAYGRLDEEYAKFYAAEMVVAVENLHRLGIVHRDLKPDNILLDDKGHIKLTDFGLSEVGVCNQKNYPGIFGPEISSKVAGLPEISQLIKNRVALVTKGGTQLGRKVSLAMPREELKEEEALPEILCKGIVGTPDYMAPEMLLETSHGRMVDWWSIGCIIFQLIVGDPPFAAETQEQVFDNIKELRLTWPRIAREEDAMSPEAQDLIQKLLASDPKKRLGYNSIDEIKKHPFFEGIDWTKLRCTEAPIIPQRRDEFDVSNFFRESKKIEENERKVPFLRRSHTTMIETASLADFNMKRNDLYHKKNEEELERLQKDLDQARQKMLRYANSRGQRHSFPGPSSMEDDEF
eukprot:TRINITY_DN7461_c0_g2_i1.p1 TRINITY_DN7461_c0_g2~~TRINITY_DN7461_c0_g2_i1.p1  ORF type:complete len:839 (-),score=239.52 TRINITY_DN7461_c0_g2_i1:1-2517(-)